MIYLEVLNLLRHLPGNVVRKVQMSYFVMALVSLEGSRLIGENLYYMDWEIFFQHEGMDYLPEELYIRYGTKRSDVSGVQALFAKRNKNGKIGLSSVQDPWKSFIANVTIDNNELIARLIPIDIMKDEICKGFKGLPKISENTDVLFKVAQLSEKYGTHIDIKDNIGEIIINR